MVSKFVISLSPRPMKYSMMAARLFPIQEIKTPRNGPKRAPFRMTIGSVGMGVAESNPMSKIEINGPKMLVLGMICSRFFIF